MKKLFVLLLVFSLVLGTVSVALAGEPVITKQPTTQTTDKHGTAIFTFTATDFNNRESSWHFINPATGDEYTGPEIRNAMASTGFKLDVYNEKQKMVLTNVPQSMNGWEIYFHAVNGDLSTDTDHVYLYCYSAGTASSTDNTAAGNTGESTGENAGTAAAGNSGADAVAEIPEKTSITVTADKVTIFPLDKDGNPLENQGGNQLTFEADSCDVAVRSDNPVKYWTINGIRIEPTEDVTGFVLKNVTSDLRISAKINKSAVKGNDVNMDVLCDVTCTGCTFTYHAGGLSSVTSGSVPQGATIIV